MWTRETINHFVSMHPIERAGAINTPRVEVTEKDDGDVWIEYAIDYWPHNAPEAESALRFALDALTQGAHVFLREPQVVVQFYLSCCDPD